MSRNLRRQTAGDPMLVGDHGQFGPESIREGGLTFRYQLGVRRLSFEAEAYLRFYRFRPVGMADLANDYRGGGRVRVEGWIGPRVRVLGEFDTAGTPGSVRELD